MKSLMKLFSYLNVFKAQRELKDLKEKYTKLETDFEALNERALEEHFEFQIYRMEHEEREPEGVELLHKKCDCGGDLVPLYYHAPSYGYECSSC